MLVRFFREEAMHILFALLLVSGISHAADAEKIKEEIRKARNATKAYMAHAHNKRAELDVMRHFTQVLRNMEYEINCYDSQQDTAEIQKIREELTAADVRKPFNRFRLTYTLAQKLLATPIGTEHLRQLKEHAGATQKLIVECPCCKPVPEPATVADFFDALENGGGIFPISSAERNAALQNGRVLDVRDFSTKEELKNFFNN
jgi:hypothetical protein